MEQEPLEFTEGTEQDGSPSQDAGNPASDDTSAEVAGDGE